MKKRVIVFVSFFLFASILAYSTGVLTIDEKYPRWFSYKGKRTYLITSGIGSIPREKELNELCASGINGYRTHIMLNYDRGAPYIHGKNSSVNNNWNGFNESFFSQLKRQAKLLEKKNSILFVVIGGTPMRKARHGTWDTHLWNSRNGGPMPSTEHGVRGFYKLGKKGAMYNLPYQKSWPWELKAQYRFEQLLVKIAQELPEVKYSNIALILMWEIYSGWNGEWALHMVRLLQSLSKYRPIGLGTYRAVDLNFINDKTTRPVFGIFEGSTYIKVLEKEKISGRYPIVGMGFHCQHEDQFSGKDPTKRCQYFCPGQESKNIKGAVDNIIKGFKSGINTSLPFPSWWHGIDVYVKKACKGKFPIEKYNSGMVKNELLKFLGKFSKRIRKMNLKKVPGKTMNKKMNKWRRKNGY